MKSFSNKKINILAIMLVIIFIAIFTFSDLFKTNKASASWYSSGGTWTHRKQITIDHNKVSGSSNLTDFPMLFSVTDADLKHTSHGGKMGKTDGTDILFTSSDGSTKLSHEIELYSSTTGQIVAWVKIPTLYTSQDTVLYVYFGNSGASDQQDITNVWDSNFTSVLHLNDNAASTNVNDSTSNSNDFTAQTNTSSRTTTGRIGAGLSFSSSTPDYLSRASITPNGSSRTVSFWAKLDSTLTFYGIVSNANSPTSGSPNWFISGNQNQQGGVAAYSGSGGYLPDVSSFAWFPAGTWAHVALTFDPSGSGSHRLYVNGNLLTSAATSDGGRETNNNYIGTGFPRATPGQFDEVRFSSTTRSAAWIATEYSNQFSPNSFYSYGAVGVENRVVPANKVNSSSNVKVRGGVKFK